ncbi:MAG: hypothetical protein IT198_11875 [Acidimicrobiia bacterium]|nr:hypothetical protein [Acidimicrobiia bacterium]
MARSPAFSGVRAARLAFVVADPEREVEVDSRVLPVDAALAEALDADPDPCVRVVLAAPPFAPAFDFVASAALVPADFAVPERLEVAAFPDAPADLGCVPTLVDCLDFVVVAAFFTGPHLTETRRIVTGPAGPGGYVPPAPTGQPL